ncbi:alpha/beta family hydrolase [Sporosarcina beigongshangi]|uniref:alpha/beta family hydrolase n=1 Tax=Sporosarcina beigongshangi TaxID=2782538 RepID=UPI0019394693|nr:alpha/beta family hydrolase [Sporosarcina beigongshangi]
MTQMKSLKVKIFTLIAIFLILLAVAFFVYVSSYYQASSLALDSLKSDSLVTVEENGDILFEPISNAKNTGFIFYPGAKVEPPAYATLAKEIASNGYTVIIAKMNFNLAILSPNRADRIIENHKDIDAWVIGGHSLGGVMAADYALENKEIKGLVLLASYPQSKTDLSNTSINVLSLWGSNDRVADVSKVNEAKNVMPSDAKFIEITGGNHGGFGDYGHQKGDGKSSLTNKQQIMETSKYIIETLDSLN